MKIDLKKWLNNPQVWGSIVAIAVMAIISVAFFYPDALDGNTLQQHDVKQGIANGEEARAFHEATGETSRWTNSLFGGMPTFQISPSYPSNALFTWIGKVYSLGLPSTSGLVMMMMMGMYWMLIALKRRWYYALIGAVAWGFSSYFVILIGAGHIWKFLTLTYVPPTLAGIIMAYRGRWLAGGAITAVALMMQLAANHIQMSYYFGFLILFLAIAYLVNAFRKHELLAWCRSSLVLVVAAILAVAANSPSLYNTYKYTAETIRGGHSELTQRNAAETSAGGLDRDYITQYSYGVGETFTLMIPNVKGGATAMPVKGGMKQLSIADVDGARDVMAKAGLEDFEKQYIEQFVSQYFGEPEGTNGPVYVGVILCALFLLGCVVVKGPLKWALIAATVLSIALAWGRNFMSLTDLFIDLVPMYNKFRTPESILVVAQLAIPVLGILALQRVLTEKDAAKRESYYKATIATFGVVALLCLVGWLFPGAYGSAINEGDRQIAVMIGESLQQQGYDGNIVAAYSIGNPRIAAVVTELRHSMVSADSSRCLLLVILAGGAILYGIKRGAEQLAATAVGVLVLVDLYTVDKRYVNHDSFMTPPPANAAIAASPADKLILQDKSYYRVMPMGQLFQSADPSYYHKSLGGYHAAKLTRYQDMIERHLLQAAQGVLTPANLNVISMLNGKYFLTADGRVQENPEALGNAWLVDTLQVVKGADAEMDALETINPASTAVVDESYASMLKEGLTAAPGDTISLAKYAPNELVYNFSTRDGANAVFSEVFFPWGWTASLADGTQLPIARVNYLLRAVSLPAGQGTLTMTFDPKSLHVTGTVATIAILIIYLWLIAAIAAALRR